jgi:hypothetical protein
MAELNLKLLPAKPSFQITCMIAMLVAVNVGFGDIVTTNVKLPPTGRNAIDATSRPKHLELEPQWRIPKLHLHPLHHLKFNPQ